MLLDLSVRDHQKLLRYNARVEQKMVTYFLSHTLGPPFLERYWFQVEARTAQ